MTVPRLLTIATAAAAVIASAACRPSAAAHTRHSLHYLSWTSSGSFSNDFVARLGKLLPDADVAIEHTSGSLVVLSTLQNGKGDFGFSLADVTYVAYRRGIEPDLYPHTNLRAVAVRWVNSLYAVVPDGSRIKRFEDLMSYLFLKTAPGQTITLTINRGGQKIPVKVTLTKRPS